MHTIKQAAKPNSLTALLNQSLATLLDLKLHAKQAHWNVKGDNFIALHELFDKAAGEIEGYGDLLAERVIQLGGSAEGLVKSIDAQSTLPSYPAGIQDGARHVRALGSSVAAAADQTRGAIDTATEAGDAVTADICTEVTRGLDKLRWFIEAHQK